VISVQRGGGADVTRAEGLAELVRADALNERLLVEEGAVARYGAVGLTLDRQLGATLVALGRTSEGIAHFERVRRRAPASVKGPSGTAVQQILVRATLALAEVRAGPGDARARGLVDEVVRLLPTPLTPTAATARTFAEIGRVRLALARRATRTPRRPSNGSNRRRQHGARCPSQTASSTCASRPWPTSTPDWPRRACRRLVR
jgi:hypothetical protein